MRGQKHKPGSRSIQYLKGLGKGFKWKMSLESAEGFGLCSTFSEAPKAPKLPATWEFQVLTTKCL
jgi:hypothetical protein